MRWLTDTRLQFVSIFPQDTETGFSWYGRIGVKDWVTAVSLDTNLFIYQDSLTLTFENDEEWI